MSEPRIILASQSPRRRELLHLIRLDHEVLPANVDETQKPSETPRAYAERVARDKALAIAREPVSYTHLTLPTIYSV